MVGGPLDHLQAERKNSGTILQRQVATNLWNENPLYLLENGRVDVGQRHDLLVVLFHSQILQHCLDGDALLGDLNVDGEDLAVGAAELDVGHGEGLEELNIDI